MAIDDMVFIPLSQNNFFIDLYGMKNVSELLVKSYLKFWNQSASRVLYLKAEILSPTDNTWVWDDTGTLIKEFGGVNPAYTKTFTFFLKRASLPSPGTSEVVQVKYSVFKDDTYSQLVDSQTVNYTFDFDDLSNPQLYTVDILDTFDDGTAPDWDGGSVSDAVSIDAGGYSYVTTSTTKVEVTRTLTKTLDIPNASKVFAVWYDAFRVSSMSSSCDWVKFRKRKVTLNDQELFYYPDNLAYIPKSEVPAIHGWFQQSVDLTAFAGTSNASLNISTNIYNDYYANSYWYLDRFALIHKP